MHSKEEIRFIKRLENHKERYVFPNEKSVVEGFEYLSSKTYKQKPHAVQNRLKSMKEAHGLKGLAAMGRCFLKRMPSIKRNINLNYSSMKDYLDEVESHETVPTEVKINGELWKELTEYAWNNHKVIAGFTEVPGELVFQDKAIPFKYALVFAQEMEKEPIEKAPRLDAGIEVIKVYDSLGIATNDIARWLREKQGVNCMANHPLGGLVDTVPLAAKAGLGAIGKHGLLITEPFGSRCRISPVFLEEKLFEYTDSSKHEWIQGFCVSCGKCRRSCPTDAIYETAKPVLEYDREDLKNRHHSYDREKCFTSFAAHMGCAVCISVCPFSKNPGIYKKMEKKHA